jgi:hypothetical protein
MLAISEEFMKTSDQVVLEEEHIEKDMNNNQQESLLQ